MSGKPLTPRFYIVIFLSLVVLTALTIGVSLLPLGEWHLAIGLMIAGVKAILVVLFFMHLYHSDLLIWIVAASGIVFLGILVILTMNDYFTRWPVGN